MCQNHNTIVRHTVAGILLILTTCSLLICTYIEFTRLHLHLHQIKMAIMARSQTSVHELSSMALLHLLSYHIGSPTLHEMDGYGKIPDSIATL